MGEHLLCKQGVIGSIPIVSRPGASGLYGAFCVGLWTRVVVVVSGSVRVALRDRRLAGRGAGVPGVLVFYRCESGSGAPLGAQDSSGVLRFRGSAARRGREVRGMARAVRGDHVASVCLTRRAGVEPAPARMVVAAFRGVKERGYVC